MVEVVQAAARRVQIVVVVIVVRSRDSSGEGVATTIHHYHRWVLFHHRAACSDGFGQLHADSTRDAGCAEEDHLLSSSWSPRSRSATLKKSNEHNIVALASRTGNRAIDLAIIDRARQITRESRPIHTVIDDWHDWTHPTSSTSLLGYTPYEMSILWLG